MAKTMSVQVKKCQLRNKPSFLGKILTKLEYGDRVDIAREENSWVEVEATKKGGGWVHISALSEKEIIVNPSSKDLSAAASSDEIALAGKGFNKQVEEQYKKNSKADFTWVDRMEKIVISPNEIQQFLQQAGLKAEGGGA